MIKINGQKIATLRRERKLSQKKIATLICSSQQMISFIELGVRQPSVELLQRIADFFNCSLDDLVIKPSKEDTA